MTRAKTRYLYTDQRGPNFNMWNELIQKTVFSTLTQSSVNYEKKKIMQQHIMEIEYFPWYIYYIPLPHAHTSQTAYHYYNFFLCKLISNLLIVLRLTVKMWEMKKSSWRNVLKKIGTVSISIKHVIFMISPFHMHNKFISVLIYDLYMSYEDSFYYVYMPYVDSFGNFH